MARSKPKTGVNLAGRREAGVAAQQVEEPSAAERMLGYWIHHQTFQIGVLLLVLAVLMICSAFLMKGHSVVKTYTLTDANFDQCLTSPAATRLPANVTASNSNATNPVLNVSDATERDRIKRCLQKTGVPGENVPYTWAIRIVYGLGSPQARAATMVLFSTLGSIVTETAVKYQRILTGEQQGLHGLWLSLVHACCIAGLPWAVWAVLRARGSSTSVFTIISIAFSIHAATINSVEGVCAGLRWRVNSWICLVVALIYLLVDYIIIIIVAPFDHNVAAYVVIAVNFEVSTGGKGTQYVAQLVRQHDNKTVPVSSAMNAVSRWLPFIMREGDAE